MLAVCTEGSTANLLSPHPHELRQSHSVCGLERRHRRMLARVRSYTPPQPSSARACSCEREIGAAALALRRCASEGGYAKTTANPWTVPPPTPAHAPIASKSMRALGATAEPAAEGRQRKVQRPSTERIAAPSDCGSADGKAAQAVATDETASAPRAAPAGKLDKDAILAPRQLSELSLLCHDIGMAEDPNERWRNEHEDTAIVLLRLHRTARVGMARSGGVLVPQHRSNKVTARVRSNSAGSMQVKTQGLPSPGPLARQQSQGPPARGLLRQKSTRPQRKCRSMTDVFEQQRKQSLARRPLELELPSSYPELFGGATVRSSSIGSPVGQVSPVSGNATAGSRLLEQHDMIFAGLFDGHGGDACARFLQQNFYRNLSREISFRCLQELHGTTFSTDAAAAIEPTQTVTLTPELMHDAFTSAYLMSNLQLKFSDNTGALTSGATAVTAVVTKDSTSGSRWLHLANIGDSAAILCTADPNNDMLWESQRLHQTHRTSTPSERSRVVGSGGFILRGRLNGSLAVTRAFGNHSCGGAVQAQTEAEFKHETTTLQCQPEPEPAAVMAEARGRTSPMEGLSVLPATRSVELDSDGSTALFLVLCCDGVTDVMSDQQIVEVVHEGYQKLMRRAQKEQLKQHETSQMKGVASKLSRWLVHTALKRGSRDNCSAIILLF